VPDGVPGRGEPGRGAVELDLTGVPRVVAASWTATELTDTFARETPVSLRARLPAARASRNRRLDTGPVTPSDSASS